MYVRLILHDLTDRADITTSATPEPIAFQFRPLKVTDGMVLHNLVRDCPPLDPNSSYCNLLQCSHFQNTSIAAVCGDELLGSVTGYRLPERQDTLFIWQVAVHPKARGQGLGRRMLHNLLLRLSEQGIRFIETSITADNEASWRLFTGFAAELNANMVRSVMLERTLHFNGAHETEHLLCIGPLEGK